MCWSPHPTARKLFHPAHALLVPKKIDIGNSVRPTELRAGRLVCNNGLLESRARLFFVREFRAAETEFMGRVQPSDAQCTWSTTLNVVLSVGIHELRMTLAMASSPPKNSRPESSDRRMSRSIPPFPAPYPA